MGKRDQWNQKSQLGFSPFGSSGSFISFDTSEFGQALVTLLFFIVMGITIISAAAIILVSSIKSASRFEQGTQSYYLAESGVEAMILQLLRNPTYTGTISISLNGGSATVSATQSNPIVILSTAQYNNYIRKIQAQTVYTNGKLIIQSWQEVQ